MLASELMSRNVIAVSRDAPLSQAVHLMVENRISGLPVVDSEGRLVGMLTEGDLLRRVETGTEGKPGWFVSLFALGRAAEQYVHTHGRGVAEVMTPDAAAVTQDTQLEEVVKLMQRRRVKRVPVVSGDKLVGIISRGDLIRHLDTALRAKTETVSDTQIVRTIRDELSLQPWAHSRYITIDAQGGVVLLDGCVFDIRERTAIGVLAENVPGVQKVENRLVCLEPYSGLVVFDPQER